jgi:hypothetical protein
MAVRWILFSPAGDSGGDASARRSSRAAPLSASLGVIMMRALLLLRRGEAR